jgi:hypothetical protein
MKRAIFVAGVGLAFGAAAAWWALGLQEAPLQTAKLAAAAPVAARPEATHRVPSSVLAIHPRIAAPVASRPARVGAVAEFLAARQYRALWERLRNSPEGATADGAYVLYRIASRCANVTDRPFWRAPNRGKPNDQVRDEFMQTLAQNDPQRDKRLAAFEQVNAARCEGLGDLTLTQADLRAMLAKAVDAGSAEARARQIEDEVRRAQRGRWDNGTLTDAQIEDLKRIATTKDPGAMLEAGRILSNSYRDITVRDGADGPVLEPQALHNAWTLVACEYGYPCQQDNPRVQEACAYRGHCEASNLQDFLYYYAASPHDSQLMTQYETMLRTAVESGDWSHLSFVRGTRPPNAPTFIVGPAS